MTTSISGEPILAPESWTFEALATAGWCEADIEWERASEAALGSLASDHREEARTSFAQAVRIASAGFSGDDPRLGASLTNHGAALVDAGEKHLSGRTLADAKRVWRDCDAWVAKMSAPRVARSSLFHLRMEQRHRGTYEARWRERWQELVEEARGKVLAADVLTLPPQAEAEEQLARWKRERPAMLNDTRKLMAAVLLLACRRV